MQQLSLTGNCIVASFLRRRVQPLMQRVHYGFEYTGPSDPSRLVADAELTEEMILERLERILGGVSVMPARVDEYDAAHPPPAVCGNLLRVLLGSCTSYSIFDFFLLLL